jgi:protein-S-isoprenylcysteine O-methyltransferase Ste14
MLILITTEFGTTSLVLSAYTLFLLVALLIVITAMFAFRKFWTILGLDEAGRGLQELKYV